MLPTIVTAPVVPEAYNSVSNLLPLIVNDSEFQKVEPVAALISFPVNTHSLVFVPVSNPIN
ncbi:hypothetical protein D3C81_1821050 [compost metagenome]